jgi:signal transduction histidine kinase
MKSRSWVVLTAGFGILIGLICLLGLGAMRRANSIYGEMVDAHEAYLRAEYPLRDIPGDIYFADLLVRDYLLDPSHLSASQYRQQLQAIRASLERRLSQLPKRAGNGQGGAVEELEQEVREYWNALNPIFEWTPAQKVVASYPFFREYVLPRRNAVVELVREVAALNAANLEEQRQRLRQSHDALRRFLTRMAIFALSVGLVVAVLSTVRVTTLERRGEQQRAVIERAEEELRRLSRNLVQAQEDERRALSRELHDAIGQMLTVMGMTLANLESLRGGPPQKFREAVEDGKRLNMEALRAVRDLAMGLRPSMLDDLGLGPALEWLGRDFSRRMGVPVTVQIDGVLEGLADAQRTCLFRVVQEALTNCARHSQAKNIRVTVHGRPGRVAMAIQDDGVGFDPASRSPLGIGLLGIEERVRELDGSVTIQSAPQRGTILRVEIPVPDGKRDG